MTVISLGWGRRTPCERTTRTTVAHGARFATEPGEANSRGTVPDGEAGVIQITATNGHFFLRSS